MGDAGDELRAANSWLCADDTSPREMPRVIDFMAELPRHARKIYSA